MFALHLVKGMHPDHFQPKEWEIFTGALVASVTDAVPRGYPQWAPSERKAAFRLLTEQIPHLINSLDLENTAKWQRYPSKWLILKKLFIYIISVVGSHRLWKLKKTCHLYVEW